jgi:uncharacterized protein YecT (DUF1311 family)
MQLIATLVIAWALCSTAYAAVHPIDQKVDACMSAAKGSEVSRCIKLGSELWGQEVTEKFKEVLSKAPPGSRSELEASQAKWITYRDAEFATIDSLHRGRSGNLNAVLKNADRAELLKARAIQLTSYAVLLSSVPEQ